MKNVGGRSEQTTVRRMQSNGQAGWIGGSVAVFVGLDNRSGAVAPVPNSPLSHRDVDGKL